MKKILPYISIFALIVGLFLPTHFAHAQLLGGLIEVGRSTWEAMVGIIFSYVGQAILTFASWFMWFGGSILNYVLKYTVMNMKTNIDSLTGINTAWKVIKDLMNIVFIFMLVYQGILIILNMAKSDIKKIITGIVLSALLVNFSLFFTKILIDASNIVTVGLYQTITTTTGDMTVNGGLSNTIAASLGLSQIYGADSNVTFWTDGSLGNNLVRLLMGLGLMLVATFVFLAIAVVFLVRYIVLIILMALSPIAYMGMGIPQIKGYANQWWEALQGQLLFGPIYMIITWVVLTLMASPGFITASNDSYSNLTALKPSFTAFGLMVNFGILIGLMIASLIISKSAASQGSKYIGQATKWATGAAGGALFATTAWGGRKIGGGLGKMAAESDRLQEAANREGRKGVWSRTKGAMANVALYGARTARDGTYDARNAAIPTAVLGDALRGAVRGAGRVIAENERLQEAATRPNAGILGRAAMGAIKGGTAMTNTNIEFGNVEVGAPMSQIAGTGAGGKLNLAQANEASRKAIEQREKFDREEYKRVKGKAEEEEIVRQSGAANRVPAAVEGTPEYDKLEKSIGKLSEKQTEAIVESNKKLLDSLNFANMISGRQLDFIMKSDKFTDDEKKRLATSRFASIKDVNLSSDDGYKAAQKKVEENTADDNDRALLKATEDKIAKAKAKIKALTDSEIEMLDTDSMPQNEYNNFVQELRSAQFESINKSNKFTSGQKKKFKSARLDPLTTTLDDDKRGVDENGDENKVDTALVQKMILRSLSGKDVAGLKATNVRYTKEVLDDTEASGYKSVNESGTMLLHPEVMKIYTPKLLKRMAEEMNPSDIQELRQALDDYITIQKKKKEADPSYEIPKNVKKLEEWFGKDDTDFS